MAQARTPAAPGSVEVAPLPPGSRLPGPLETIAWLRRPVAVLERGRRRYGKVFRLSLGPAGNVAIVGDPAAAKLVVRGDPDVFRAGDPNGVFRNVVGNNSILVLDGDEHLEHRKLLLPAFAADHVRAYARGIEEVTLERLERWPVGEPFGLQDEMEAIAFETIMRIAFGRRGDERHDRLRRLVPEMMERCASPLLMLPWFRQDLGGLSPAAKTRALIAEIDAVLFELIREQRGDPMAQLRTDVAAMLSRARHPDGTELSDREIRDEILTLLMAGYETTTSALAWSFERLLRTPAVFSRLREEIDGDRDEYLDAVVKEVLRIRPVIPVVARRLRAPSELAGFTLPAGWIAMASIYLVHRDPEAFPEPDRFRPERFLGGDQPEAWMPFGGGVRRCLGAGLAQTEIKVVLRTVLRHAALRAVDPADEQPVRRRFTFAPRHGASVIADAISADKAIPPSGRFAPERARWARV